MKNTTNATSCRVRNDKSGFLGRLTSLLVVSILVCPSFLVNAAPTSAQTEVKITAPSKVTGGQAGYSAFVGTITDAKYSWTAENATIMVGGNTDCISFVPGKSGNLTLTCKVTEKSGASATGTVKVPITPAQKPRYNIDQALSDKAQSTTIAFAGFGMITGNLGAQSFFPPGKVADYWGFQCLRDNDADKMGHNTSFLTKVACNMLSIFNDTQLSQLKVLAKSQVSSINLYAWKRYPLMKAFRRLMDGTAPKGSAGLSLDAVKAASKELYLLDGQISYERAVVFADIFRSFTTAQKKHIGGMAGKGFKSWPEKDEKEMKERLRGLPRDEVVAVMTYASDLYSWFAGSIVSDVYFCPERHGTYYGSFYIKDAPAMGRPGYTIDESLTGTVGNALCNSKEGYISNAGAKKMNDLVETQRKNLYKNPTSNIVLARTKISEALRRLIATNKPGKDELAKIKAEVDKYSAIYGELDGENNYHYATTFHQLFNNIGGSYISNAQKEALANLRRKYMTVTYPDGQTIDFSNCTKHFLFAAEVQPTSPDFVNYTNDQTTDKFFRIP